MVGLLSITIARGKASLPYKEIAVSCKTTLLMLGITCGLGLTVSSCSLLQLQKPTNSAASPTPSPASSSPSPAATTPPVAKTLTAPDLTAEKLKNAEYYFLAKGPVKLVNGKYEDPETKRIFTMSDVVAYGDLNKDGIKDAVTAIQITIPNQGDFSYLAAFVNDNGNPRNIAAEFLGPQVKVKTITVKPEQTIDVQMDQYQPGATQPTAAISQTFKLKDPASQASPSATPTPETSPTPTPQTSPKS